MHIKRCEEIRYLLYKNRNFFTNNIIFLGVFAKFNNYLTKIPFCNHMCFVKKLEFLYLVDLLK